MEGVRKAILRIDCENGTKEAVSSPNEAARKILNHGSTDMAFGQEKCEIVVQYNPASIKYRAGISQNRSIKYERQNKEVYKYCGYLFYLSFSQSFRRRSVGAGTDGSALQYDTKKS